MIEVAGLHKRFGEVVAVEDVSFRADDGRITGLLGPNGAGKTTTLRVLYTLVRPDRGERAGRRRRRGRASRWQARRRLGVLPDARGLYPRLTAREHIRYFGELHGLRGARAASAHRRAGRAARHARHRRPPRRRASRRASA